MEGSVRKISILAFPFPKRICASAIPASLHRIPNFSFIYGSANFKTFILLLHFEHTNDVLRAIIFY